MRSSESSLNISIIILETFFSAADPFLIFFVELPLVAKREESLGEVSPSTVIVSKLSLRAAGVNLI